jgi:uncharacterized protein (TIGR03663 family)
LQFQLQPGALPAVGQRVFNADRPKIDDHHFCLEVEVYGRRRFANGVVAGVRRMTGDAQMAKRLRVTFWILGTMVLMALAAQIRWKGISARPLHADEAVHAFKLDELIKGTWTYDPHDYHGPTIYYFALPILKMAGARDIAEFTDVQLRLVPLIFGVALIPLLWLLRDAIGKTAMAAAGIFTALSPAMVFYSDYYIQEMVFVFFTAGAIACVWRYTLTKRFGWLIGCSIFFGLAASTKETWIISAAAAAWGILAVWVHALAQGRPRFNVIKFARELHAWRVVALIGVAFFVWAAVLSVGFSKPRGIIDGFRFFSTYVTRNAEATEHHHPWNYYLSDVMGIGWGINWTEGVILPLAALGFLAAATGIGIKKERRDFAFFTAAFAIFVLMIYSAISYKTPWCLLTFIWGMIVLAGIGVSAAIALVRPYLNHWAAIAAAVLLAAPVFFLQQRAALLTVKLSTNEARNPYVYSGTLGGARDVQAYVEKLVKIKPDAKICMEMPESWPMAWYLRRVPARYIGPLQKDHAEILDADVYVLVSVNHKTRPEIAGYVEGGSSLRKNVGAMIYTRQKLFDQFVAAEEARMEQRK